MTKNQTIAFVVPGGTFTLPGGDTATVDVQGFEPLVQAHPYLIFAKFVDGYYRPAGWTRGMFEANRDCSLRAFSHKFDTPIHAEAKEGLLRLRSKVTELSQEKEATK